jgi:hypothetical protein
VSGGSGAWMGSAGLSTGFFFFLLFILLTEAGNKPPHHDICSEAFFMPASENALCPPRKRFSVVGPKAHKRITLLSWMY